MAVSPQALGRFEVCYGARSGKCSGQASQGFILGLQIPESILSQVGRLNRLPLAGVVKSVVSWDTLLEIVAGSWCSRL